MSVTVSGLSGLTNAYLDIDDLDRMAFLEEPELYGLDAAGVAEVVTARVAHGPEYLVELVASEQTVTEHCEGDFPGLRLCDVLTAIYEV